MSIFKTLGLSQAIVDSLVELGYEQPTEIQKISIPQILGSKDDLKAFAQTGTGKTAAFICPYLSKLIPTTKIPRRSFFLQQEN